MTEVSRVAIAISSFRNDSSVLGLVERITSERWPVEHIFIVDSQGTGRVERAIDERGWSGVSYHDSDANLGSAGNLQKRLELALEAGFEFVLALNHDALVNKEVLLRLLEHRAEERLGALYSLRYYTGKGMYDLTGESEPGMRRAVGTRTMPTEDKIPVIWSSSNVALYALKPLQRGLRPRGELWMGWEDYLYGLDLASHGYKQYIIPAAKCEDNYEYKSLSIFGVTTQVADKPTWYFYYRTRNLGLIALHYHASLRRALLFGVRALMDATSVLLGVEKTHPARALSYVLRGAIDGVRGREGKWRHP